MQDTLRGLRGLRSAALVVVARNILYAMYFSWGGAAGIIGGAVAILLTLPTGLDVVAGKNHNLPSS